MKKGKLIVIIIALLLGFVSVMAIIYGQINMRNAKANLPEDSIYTKAVEESIKMCNDYSSILEDSTDYDATIQMYQDNINDESSVQIKAYIAGNMVTYALNYFSQKSIDFEAKLTKNGAVSPYTKVITDLSEKQIELQNLV